MAYTKNVWKDQNVQRPRTYEVIQNQDSTITLNDSFGVVTEIGTPVNATNMNHIEDGIADNDTAITTINGKIPSDASSNNKLVSASTLSNAVDNLADKDLSNLTNDGENRLHALKGYSDEGELLTDAEGLADIKKYAHSSFDLSKFTVVGSPAISEDGILRGTNNANFVRTPSITITNSNDVKIYARIYTAGLSGNNFLFSMNNGSYVLYPALNVNNKITLFYGIRESNNIYLSFTNVPFPPIVDILVHFNKGTVYLKAKTPSETEYSQSVSAVLPENYSMEYPLRIGTTINNDYRFKGSIDLKQFQIEADGIPVFSGNKTGIDTIKPDNYTVVGNAIVSDTGIASGFLLNTQNYVTLDKKLDFTKSFQLDLKLNTGTSYDTSNEAHYFFSSIAAIGNMVIGFNNAGKLLLFLSSNGTTSWNIANGMEGLNTYQNANTDYWIRLTWNGTEYKLQISANGINYVTELIIQNSLPLYSDVYQKVGNNQLNGNSFEGGTVDLNCIKFYSQGNLIFQPCLKIPYTAGSNQYGGKYVDVAYRNRVQDAYEQGLANDYFTIDEENQNFTLPMGEVYGMIGDKVSKKGDTMTGTLDLNRQYSESGGPQYLRFNNTEYDFNNPPEGHLNEYLTFYDKNGIDIATIQHRFGTAYNDLFLRVRPLGDTTTSISVLPGLAMRTLANGDTYAYVQASDIVNSILTTEGINKAANGYVKLGNGIIIQWGANLTASSQNPTITFPTAFSSSNYFAMAYGRGATNWDHTWGFKNSATATSCKFYLENGDMYQWIAIGY